MSILPELSTRRLRPELMDQPDLDTARLLEALRGLERINLASRSTQILWPPIRDLAARLHRNDLSLLDVACGAGDVARGLWRRSRQAGWTGTIAGCDINPRSLDYARQRSRRAGADLRFFELDALRDPLPEHDVIISSLFLHHLAEDDAVDILRKIAAAARWLVLINDLARCRRGYLLAMAATRMLSRCDVVHADGPQSVAAAFMPGEALALAKRAGMHEVSVETRWPCRYLLIWQRT
jgi:SAM-dependent methyltransferase